jgi:hypothetical protein
MGNAVEPQRAEMIGVGKARQRHVSKREAMELKGIEKEKFRDATNREKEGNTCIQKHT